MTEYDKAIATKSKPTTFLSFVMSVSAKNGAINGIPKSMHDQAGSISRVVVRNIPFVKSLSEVFYFSLER